MCSKWLFHFLAEKRLWIPNRFSARLFHDFGKRGRGNREPRRPRMERTPPASCTHACQAPSAPASSVAREWDGHNPRPAYVTYIQLSAPTFSGAQLFQKSTIFYETLGKFTKRCAATDSNNMRIASCTLNLPKICRKPSTMSSDF